MLILAKAWLEKKKKKEWLGTKEKKKKRKGKSRLLSFGTVQAVPYQTNE